MKFIFLFGFFIFNSSAIAESMFSQKNQLLEIYRYSFDMLNCQNEKAIEPSMMQEELTEKEVTIFSIKAGYDGLIYPLNKQCAHPQQIIIFSILKSDYQKIQSLSNYHLCSDLEAKGGNCHPEAYVHVAPKSKNSFFVHVYKHSNKMPCDLNSQIPLDKMEEELNIANIFVYQRYSALDGSLSPLSCDVKMDHINVYVIESSGLFQSIEMGFKSCINNQNENTCIPIE